jgi:preprotein translocase subunit YajC
MSIYPGTLLMMSPQGGASGGNSSFIQIAFFLGILIVLYFFMIRPQQKKTSDAKKFMDTLQKGDKIVSVAGIHGRITKINETGPIEVEIDTNVKVMMERSGISMEYTKAIQDKK